MEEEFGQEDIGKDDAGRKEEADVVRRQEGEISGQGQAEITI